MEPVRKFKIIVNSKECGTCSGPTLCAVAKKVVKKLCGSSSKTVLFSLKECKRGCERVCGPYQGRMEKLDRPYKRDGKKITHRVVCGKVRKMRGGTLGKDGENLTMDDFKVQDKSFSFLRLETIGKLGKFGFGSTKEQYAFFNPLNNNESNNNESNNNERRQDETEQTNQNTNEKRFYYQYVAIRKKDKDVVFKKYDPSVEKNSHITEVNISNIDTNILLDLLTKIKKEIKKQRETKEDFDANSILKKLEEYLKNKVRSNLKIYTLSWKLFKIKEENPSPIKYFSFGKKTSRFGNKNQYIFFDIVELYPNHYFYQYVVIRDENKIISLKKIVIDDDGIMEILDFGTFESVSSNKSGQGQLILEKLHRDILMLIDNNRSSESSNFATTIRNELSRYTFGDKETDLVPDSFLINNTDDFVVSGKYVFFSDILLFKKCSDLSINCEYTKAEYELYRKYYMYVMFVDKKNNINFKQLKLFKGTPIILEVDMKDYIILEWLYSKINYLCDLKNNQHLFNILFALEKFSVHQERTLLKSRDFYITAQEQKEMIRILTKKNKTFIFFKRLKGRRTINLYEDFILYEYAIIIDEDRIEFYTIKDQEHQNKALSMLIKYIQEINIDDIDVLLLTLLYEELIKISGNDSSRNNLEKLKRFLKQKIGKYYEFKKKVEKILRSNIKNNKITINGQSHNIEYDGQFTFNFFDNENNSEKLKDFLKRILKTKKIHMLSDSKFLFKPHITSIAKTSNNLNTNNLSEIIPIIPINNE